MKNLILFFSFILFLNPLLDIFAQNYRSDVLYISGDTFSDFCDVIVNNKTGTKKLKRIKPGDAVFVRTDELEFFFTKLHPSIKNPYILVTHNSDHSAPRPFDHYLDDPKIIAWFGQNSDGVSHPKFHPIPIGIANKRWPHGNVKTLNTVQNTVNNTSKSILLYMNFKISNCPDERSIVYEKFVNEPFCKTNKPIKFKSYLSTLTQCKFVLSPRGNGLDCHRHWEAMLMGAIPIIKSSSIDSLFEGLPVLIIHDWDEITEDFLNQKWVEINSKEYQMEKLYANYWLQMISSYKIQPDQ